MKTWFLVIAFFGHAAPEPTVIGPFTYQECEDEGFKWEGDALAWAARSNIQKGKRLPGSWLCQEAPLSATLPRPL